MLYNAIYVSQLIGFQIPKEKWNNALKRMARSVALTTLQNVIFRRIFSKIDNIFFR